ncbi:MAG: hypothetical protein EU530_08965 [Promethearchaeota archaeon]|nr:MAG: hypothetical protein EU530_08965 [Candidatus Lokiarchaeota archaeon]
MKNENHRNYRFWALFAASFIRTFYNSIYGLALPNYYIYTKSVSSSLVGAISSIAAITYIFGPLLGRLILNVKRTTFDN